MRVLPAEHNPVGGQDLGVSFLDFLVFHHAVRGGEEDARADEPTAAEGVNFLVPGHARAHVLVAFELDHAAGDSWNIRGAGFGAVVHGVAAARGAHQQQRQQHGSKAHRPEHGHGRGHR